MTRFTGAVLGLLGGAVVGGWLAVLLAIGLFVATDGQMSSAALAWAGSVGGACGAVAGVVLGVALASRSRRPGRYVAAHDVWGMPLSTAAKKHAQGAADAGSRSIGRTDPDAERLPDIPPLLLDERLTRRLGSEEMDVGRQLVYARGTIPLNGNVRIISPAQQDTGVLTFCLAAPTGVTTPRV